MSWSEIIISNFKNENKCFGLLQEFYSVCTAYHELKKMTAD